MNTQKLSKKNSLMILLVMVLTLVFSLATTHKASASNGIINDGKGCIWWKQNSSWMGVCLKPYNTTTGYIWGYNGAMQNPWIRMGWYDANYEYYYNFRGGYQFGIERASGKTICPSGNYWFYSNIACPNNTSNNYYAVVGGTASTTTDYTFTISSASNYLNDYANIYDVLSDANSRSIDTWLAPNCNASYYGCR